MAAAKKNGLPLGSLDQIRSAQDIGQDVIEVPEWGCSVRVRGLTRGEARKAGAEGSGVENAEAFAFSAGLVEPTVSEEEALELLADKSFAATERILNRILALSGLTPGFRTSDAD